MDFINFLSVCIYLALIRIIGLFAGYFNCQLVGQIAAGVIVGPYGLNMLPFLDAFDLLGMFGLSLLVLQGSLGINLDDISRTFKAAFWTATIGVILPVLLCGFLIYVQGGNLLVNCFSAAACMASTSIGTASALLQQYSQSKSTLGCLITSAAMLDDVMSLVLLAILSIGITSSHLTTTELTWIVIRPILVSLIMITLTSATVKIIKLAFNGHQAHNYVDKNWQVVAGQEIIAPQEQIKSDADENPLELSKRIPNTQTQNILLKTLRKILKSTDFQISAILALAVGLACAANYAGTTYLLGVFCAGIILAPFPLVGQRFCDSLRPLLEFFSAMFFGAIGLAIPISALADFSTIWQGLILTMIGFITKWICGLLQYIPYLRVISLSGKNSVDRINSTQVINQLIWIEANVIGLAMVSRGEIGYLMALQLFSTNTISQELYGQLIWALTLCTIISPPLFAFALQKRIEKLQLPGSPNTETNGV